MLNIVSTVSVVIKTFCVKKIRRYQLFWSFKSPLILILFFPLLGFLYEVIAQPVHLVPQQM